WLVLAEPSELTIGIEAGCVWHIDSELGLADPDREAVLCRGKLDVDDHSARPSSLAHPAYASAEGCSPSAANIFFRPCSRMSGKRSTHDAPARSASSRAIALNRSIARAMAPPSPKVDPAGDSDQSGCPRQDPPSATGVPSPKVDPAGDSDQSGCGRAI